MCEPKPITFSRISFLNPVTIEIAIIMTEKPKAIPIIAIRMIGREAILSLSCEKAMRLAIWSS